MRKVKTNRRYRIFGLFAMSAMAIGVGVSLAPRGNIQTKAATSSGTEWKKITSLANLTEGKYVFMADNNTTNIMGVSRGGAFQDRLTLASAGTNTDLGANVINDQTMVWELKNTGTNEFTINSFVDGANGYLYYTGSKNEIQYGTTVQSWKFEYTSSLFKIQNQTNTGRYLQYNNSAPRFAGYTGTLTNISLYKMEEGAPGPSFGVLKSIAIKAATPKTTFLVGETFSRPGLMITATDNSTPAVTKDLTSGFETDYDDVEFTSAHLGTKEVEISYQDVEDGPIAYAYYNITIEKAPHYHTGFESGEGFTASTTYNNTTVAFTGPNGGQWGTYYGTPATAGAISGGQSLQMRWYTSAVNNLGYTYTDFDIDGASKVDFKAKQTNGLKVRVDYSTNSGSDWIEGQVFSPTESGDEFTYDVPLTAQQSSKLRFKFQLVLPASNPSGTSNLYIDDVAISEAPEPVALSKIEITEQPTKKDYYVGDSFDPAGLEVTATYADNSEVIIDNSLLDFTPEHNLQLTDTSILVEFGGEEATISGISVTTRPTLSKIEVTQNPAKMVYKQFESFDKDGMEVTASYSNSETEVVTNYSVSPETFEVIGASIPVTISYTFNGDTKSTTLYVEVTEIPVPTDIIANSKHTHASQNEKISIDDDDDLSGSVIDSLGYVESIVALSGNVYLGAKSHIQHNIQPLVIGSSSGSGSIKLVLSDEISISAITIYASRRTTGGNAATLKVNDLDVQTVGAAGVADDMFVDYVFEGVNSNEIVITSANNFATYIYGIDLEYTTYEEDALAFANEVMTGRGNFEQGTCHAVLADLEAMYDGLSEWAQLEFDTADGQIFVDARARLDYLRVWTAANPEPGAPGSVIVSNQEITSLTATIIIGVIGLTTLAGYYFIQKKQRI